MNENLQHYNEIAKNLRAEGQISRADAVEYLIRRCETAEELYMLKSEYELVGEADEKMEFEIKKAYDRWQSIIKEGGK